MNEQLDLFAEAETGARRNDDAACAQWDCPLRAACFSQGARLVICLKESDVERRHKGGQPAAKIHPASREGATPGQADPMGWTQL